MESDNVFLLAVTFMVLVGGSTIGFTIGDRCDHEPLQDAAVERGYAEWVLPENGRGKTVWRWVEPEEGNRHEWP